MKNIRNQAGMVAIEAMLIAIVVLAVGFIGWRVYSANQSADKQFDQSASKSDHAAKSETIVTPPQINSASDLDKATQALDQLDEDTFNNQDVSQLASQASAF